jgi:hypothetical protein
VEVVNPIARRWRDPGDVSTIEDEGSIDLRVEVD